MSDLELRKKLGSRIKKLRKQQKWTQKDLSAKIDVRFSQLNKYEAGLHVPPVEKLILLAEIYNTTEFVPEDEKLLLKYYIESYETKKELEEFSKFQRIDAKKISVLLFSFRTITLILRERKNVWVSLSAATWKERVSHWLRLATWPAPSCARKVFHSTVNLKMSCMALTTDFSLSLSPEYAVSTDVPSVSTARM